MDAVPSSGICRHQHLHDEFFLVFAAREFHPEMDYNEAWWDRWFSAGGTLFPRSRVGRVRRDDLLGHSRDSIPSGDLHYD